MNSCKPILDHYRGNPKRWAQYELAKNNKDEAVNVDADDATSWCLLGAYMFVKNHNKHMLESGDKVEKELRRRVAMRVGVPLYVASFTIWNDSIHRKFEDIIELLSQEDVEDKSAVTELVNGV